MQQRYYTFLKGAALSYPIYIAFVFMFGAFAMLARAHDVHLSETMLMTGMIFAVPLQALLIENQDFSLLTTGLSAFILNFKFMLMSTVILPLWHRHHLPQIMSLHFMTSSTYMFCMAVKDIENRWYFYLGVALPAYAIALLSTFMGYHLWDIAASHQQLLNALAHIILPIYFLCLTITRKGEQKILFCTLLGMMITPVIRPIFGKESLLLFWIIIAGVLCFFSKAKELKS